jgi:hypothetical protein
MQNESLSWTGLPQLEQFIQAPWDNAADVD